MSKQNISDCKQYWLDIDFVLIDLVQLLYSANPVRVTQTRVRQIANQTTHGDDEGVGLMVTLHVGLIVVKLMCL